MDRLESIPGAAALDAAIALDTMALTGAARAALLKEMRTAAAEALKGVPKQAGKLEGIRAQREARLAAAGRLNDRAAAEAAAAAAGGAGSATA